MDSTFDSIEGLFSLRGKIGLVTGASSGLGVEFARALAVAGADVALVARRKERLEDLARELRAKGVRALPIQADVTVDGDLDRIVEEATAGLGEIDILINNAGVTGVGRAEKLSAEVWDQTMAINLRAPMLLSQRVARRMIDQQRPGRMINIGSVYSASASSIYRLAAYCASKSALANLSRQLAVEWARYNINVNVLAPGWFPTEMNEGGLDKPGGRDKMEAWTPMARLGRLEELRAAVIFLAGPGASFVTGTVLSVDGGFQAW